MPVALARVGAAPGLVHRPPWWENAPEVPDAHKPPKIVLGYDGSDTARRALSRAREMAPQTGTVIVVAVSAEVGSPSIHDEPLVGGETDTERLLDEAAALLDPAGGPTVERRAATGDPAAVLVQITREVDADLLIVGRRGGDFVTRTLRGSVAERVVQQARCDVLVVS